MPQELTTALKTAKDIEKQLVVAENRLAYIQEETKRLTTTRDSIQEEINKKSADYDVYIGKRDADSKKIRQDALDEQSQLLKDKTEFQTMLQAFQKERQVYMESKQGFENEKKKNELDRTNIREFIIAVQRACSVIGL
jgi:uncharacterized protein (DUF3084 family)